MGSDLIFWPWEECYKLLKLLEDIITLGEYIFDHVVHALHEYSMFCRVMPLDIGSIMLVFGIIGRTVAIG
jgi:hypothetical protein